MLPVSLLCFLIISSSSPADSLFPPPEQTVSPLVKLVELNNAFAIKIYRSLAWNDSNLFICPFAISSGLMALLQGARDKTGTELNQTLGFAENKLYKEKFLDAFVELSSKVKSSEIKPTFAVSSSLFLQEDFGLNRTYKSVADHTFKLQITEVDYRRNGVRAVSSINEWFWRTAGKSFRNLTSVAGALVNMIMASSVTLRTNWTGLSVQNFTSVSKPFYNNGVDDNVVTVNMIERKAAPLLVADSYDFRALDIPCGASNFSIWILLPHRKDGLVGVEDSLSTKLFQEVAASFREVEADVVLPKLKIEYDVDVSKVLQKMGIKSAFSETNANFPTITSAKGFALSKVIHKGIVELDIKEVMNKSNSPSEEAKEFLNFSFGPYRSARHDTDVTTDLPESDAKGSKLTSSEVPQVQSEVETGPVEKIPKKPPKAYPFIVDHPFMLCLMEKSTGLIHSIARVLRF